MKQVKSSVKSHNVGIHVADDVYQRLQRYAEEHRWTISSAGSFIFSQFLTEKAVKAGRINQ